MDYFSVEEGVLCKAKSVLSSLYGFTSCSPTLQPPLMQNPKGLTTTIPLAGLKTLLLHSTPCYSPHLAPSVIHRYMILPSSSTPAPSLSSSSSSFFPQLPSDSSSYTSDGSSTLDDLIGTESGVYMNSNMNIEEEPCCHHKNRSDQHCKMRRRRRSQRKYPPPIPLLARTGNLQGHMPWVLSRHHVEGKLILRKDILKHQEYFEAYRENGRLILNLVALDDTIGYYCQHSADKRKEGNEEVEEEYDLEDQKERQEIETCGGRDDCNYLEDNQKENRVSSDTSTTTSSSVPKLSSEDGSICSARFGDVPECLRCLGKTKSDYIFSCNAIDFHGNAGIGYIAQSGSASLPVAVCSTTAVV